MHAVYLVPQFLRIFALFIRTGKLPFEDAPADDRRLPDMHLALYNDVVVFDHATKLAYVIAWVHIDDHRK